MRVCRVKHTMDGNSAFFTVTYSASTECVCKVTIREFVTRTRVSANNVMELYLLGHILYVMNSISSSTWRWSSQKYHVSHPACLKNTVEINSREFLILKNVYTRVFTFLRRMKNCFKWNFFGYFFFFLEITKN